MLKLTTHNIELQQTASEKTSAIKNLAASLAKKGMVEDRYVEGMLNREAQHSTYLGSGIAIPHGTTDTRDLVQHTGVMVHHFPEGINWGDNNIVYVAIGIAAKSDEHLGILKQLTKVLSADDVEESLKRVTSAQQLIDLLNGDVQFNAEFSESLIQTNFPANDMIQLSAVAGSLLKNVDAVESTFVAELINKAPTYLGKGLWVNSNTTAVSRTAMSVVTTSSPFSYNNKPVNSLISFAVCNQAHQTILATLSDLVFQGKQELITQADSPALIELFSNQEHAESPQTDAIESTANIATFKIKNAHGLHARPGAMLVAEAKKFESAIKVRNLDGEGGQVNAKSLMKVIALGVKHGHQLEFSAEGSDATKALCAIGSAIESGLGEG